MKSLKKIQSNNIKQKRKTKLDTLKTKNSKSNRIKQYKKKPKLKTERKNINQKKQ